MIKIAREKSPKAFSARASNDPKRFEAIKNNIFERPVLDIFTRPLHSESEHRVFRQSSEADFIRNRR